MSVATPHFLLFSESNRSTGQGDWRFVLRATDGSETVEIADSDFETQGERLELLAVVRGLEALDQPSRVTLVTPSKYVNRGLTQGLEEWRSNGWQWERHGEMVPIKNRDLWERVDGALRYHQINCHTYRMDRRHDLAHEEPPQGVISIAPRLKRATGRSLRRRIKRFFLSIRRDFRNAADAWRLRLAQCGTSFMPVPWLN